jgi:chemotaxis protein CheD
MTDRNNVVTNIYLKPGESVISDKSSIVSTVLGSCISVTMFNRQLRIGAISHNLLPSCRDKDGCSGDCPEASRYVECTIRRMVKKFTSLGIGVDDIEVKVFGGSDMLGAGDVNSSATTATTVGAQNVETAIRILGSLRLKLAASDTGSKRGRRIIFHTHTGEVFLKRLHRTESNEYDSE